MASRHDHIPTQSWPVSRTPPTFLSLPKRRRPSELLHRSTVSPKYVSVLGVCQYALARVYQYSKYVNASIPVGHFAAALNLPRGSLCSRPFDLTMIPNKLVTLVEQGSSGFLLKSYSQHPCSWWIPVILVAKYLGCAIETRRYTRAT